MSDSLQTVLHNTADVLLRTVLPAVDGDHTRAVVLQLAAVARYAADHETDPSHDRATELVAVIGAYLGDAGVAALVTEPLADTAAVMRCTAAILVAALGSDDDPLLACAARLRAALVGDLDTDLAAEAPLIEAFRGRMPA